MTPMVRYSDEELAEFKALIEKKLNKTRNQYISLKERVASIAESMDEEGDWMDDSSSHADLEMLQNMANRQGKHIADLEKALRRIENKSYGICVVTGELIDKRRLNAVLTTTKSLAAKTASPLTPEKKERKPIITKPRPAEPKIITRIIRKSTVPKPITALDMEDEDYTEEEDNYDDNDTINEEKYDTSIDLDSIVDAESEDNDF